MHEFSIVQNLIDLVEKFASKNGADRVSKVVVSVGVLSGVEPHLLELAFETFKEGTVAEKAKIVIEVEKLKVRCFDCEQILEKEEPNAICPLCGSLNTEVEGGDELILKSLELEYEEKEAQDKS